MNQQPFTVTKSFIALLACLTGITALGIDLVLPIFPEMIAYYQLPHDEHNRIQQIVFVYMLGFSVFQLLFGVLADTVGRKPLLHVGIGIYALAAISVILLKDFDNVLLARFIQGAGLAAPRVLTTTIVRDISSGREMSRIMSFITMVFLAVPAVAPMIGQLMVLFAPWQSVFIMLAACGVVLMVWVQLSFTETLTKENRRPLSLHKVRLAIVEFIGNHETQLQILIISAMFGSLMIYIGQAEQVLQKDIYQLGKWFPLAFATIVIGMVSAALTNARIVMRVGLYHILRMAVMLITLADVVFILAVWLNDGVIPLWGYILAMAVHFFCFGLIMPNVNTLALAPYHHIAGTASAMIGMITSVLGLSIAQVFSHFYHETLYSMANGFLFCLLVLLLSYGFFLKVQSHH